MSDLLDLSNDMKDVQAPQILPAGTEAKLRIIRVKKGVDKNNVNYLMPLFEIDTGSLPPGVRLTKDFSKYIPLPCATLREAQGDKRYEQAKYDLSQFFAAFGFDFSRPFDPETAMLNKTGWAILGVQEDPNYGEQNTIQKWIVQK